MKCPKCNYENLEGSVFCSKCGEKLIDQSSEKKEKDNHKHSFSKRKRLTAVISSILILLIGILLVFMNNPVKEFKDEIKNNNVKGATEIFNEDIKGDPEKENEARDFLRDESHSIKESYINNKISYEEAKERYDTIQGTHLIPGETMSDTRFVDKIKASRNSYKKAKEYQNEKKYIEAIKEYGKVIKEDNNYDLAQKEIKGMKVNYKKDVLKRVQVYENNQEFEKALSLLKEADAILAKDSEIEKKLTAVEKQQIEKLNAEQIVIVEDAKITVQTTDSTYKLIYPDMIQVTVKNGSDKTIKNMEVASLGYDDNGYPVKIEPQLSLFEGDYEFIGKAENVNIVPGASFGGEVGWELDDSHNISTVISCVKHVTFYDGSTWNNPYYKFWIEENKEKPIF